MRGFSLAELAKEAAREAAMRRSVYARWIFTKRMTKADADRKIAMMETIAEKLAAEAEGELVEERLI